MTMPTEIEGVLPEESTANPDDGGMAHLYCCDENLSLCGLDISNGEFCPDPPNCCPWCDALWEMHVICEKCGKHVGS